MAIDTSSNSSRFSVGCVLFSVTLVAVAIGGYVAFTEYIEGEDIIATIDCGGDREVIISVARSWEVTQPIYYQIRENGKVIVPLNYFDNRDPPSIPQFTHAIADGGNLVGVAYADDPTSYLFIHDFSSCKTYGAADRRDLEARLNRSR